ncbi:sensor histidine kinase [Streptomyces sp. NPDC001919]
MTTARSLWGRIPLRWWRRASVLIQDAVLAAALFFLAFIPTLSVIGAQIGDLPERRAGLVATALVLAQTAPLTLRRTRPAVCLGLIAAAFAAHQALGYATTFASLGLYAALYSAGAHLPRHRRTLPAAACVGYILLAVVLHRLGSPQTAVDYLAFSFALCGFWLLGHGVRVHRAREAEQRRLTAEAAIAAERARIARELHDVVTHHVTAMVIQSDAAQFLIPSAPEQAGKALSGISDAGRTALTELRSLLGVLEATGNHGPARTVTDRAPALGQLTDLVEQARRSGQPVRFTEQGPPATPPPDVRLVAYRVVQEALTNAMKHAPGHPTSITVHHQPERLVLTITTEGTGTSPTLSARLPGAGGGRGLIGLKERVRALHGDLRTATRPAGGFEVRATLPVQGRQD